MFINRPILPFYRCINSLSYVTYCVPISLSQRKIRPEKRGVTPAVSTGKHVAGSWWCVQTPACHDVWHSASVRLRVVMRRFLKVVRRIERPTLSVVIHGLPLLGLSFTSCVSLYRSRSLDMILRLTLKSTATSRCFHPASKWPMALDRSTLDNFTIFTDQYVKVVQNCKFDSLWVANELIDDQSCLWAVAQYWHR